MSMQAFDLTSSPLPEGKLLIEASAGTGKTYSLVGIILRLLLEVPTLRLENILLMTYTEAATAELQDRVWSGIVNLISAIESPEAPKDALLAHLRQRVHNDPQPDLLLQRIKDARAAFDQANIHTIHGFCARMLVDNAFESSSLFDTEVIASADALLESIAKDAWRDLQFRDQTSAQQCCLETAGIRSLDNLTAAVSQPPAVNAASDSGPLSPMHALQNCAASLGAAAAAFRDAAIADIDELRHFFLHGTSLKANIYNAKRLPHIEAFFTDIAADSDPLPAILRLHQLGTLPLLGLQKVTASLKKNATAPADWPMLGLADAIGEEITSAINSFKFAIYTWGQQRLIQLKRQLNVMTFDDMIQRMHHALATSPQLVDNLRERFKVALVDEFQDTDSTQLDIFRRIFDAPGQRFYCVGDPKQSIYEFRGADIQTYLEISANPEFQCFALRTNFRSDQHLVDAVNLLFGNTASTPFGDAIEYQTVTVPPHKRCSGPPQQPAFIFREIAERSMQQMPAAVAAAVRDIKQRFPEFTFSDIAVLVDANWQAEAIAQRLNACAIPSVRKLDQSVFATSAAFYLQLLLESILQPRSKGLAQAVMATPLFAHTATEIQDRQTPVGTVERTLNHLAEAAGRWRANAFYPAMHVLFQQEDIRAHLLTHADGEAMLSHLNHLLEVMHLHATQNGLTPEALLGWLVEMIGQCDQAEAKAEAFLVRRTSDADAVVLSTIHRSKGLQYKAVIAPTLWRRGHRDTKPDEAMRKLYVALTRPQHLCVVLLGEDRDSDQSSLAQLLQGHGSLDLIANAKGLAQQSAGLIGYEPPLPILDSTQAPNAADTTPLRLEPAPLIPPQVFRTSFSGIVSRASQHPLEQHLQASTAQAAQTSPEWDKMDTTDATGDDSLPASEDPLPKGAQTGLALHAVLEHIDFTNDSDHPQVVAQWMGREGLTSPQQHAFVLQRLHGWLSTPLIADGTLCLNEITTTNRLNELAFHFPLQAANGAILANAIAAEQLPQLQQRIASVGVPALARFMIGFIDMVCRYRGRYYIVDWKSNFLGSRSSDYHQQALATSMLDSLYHLQYLIYTVAFDAYMRNRCSGYSYDEHFGGIVYVYLRGFGHAPGHAVYHRRPHPQTILALRRCLIPQ